MTRDRRFFWLLICVLGMDAGLLVYLIWDIYIRPWGIP